MCTQKKLLLSSARYFFWKLLQLGWNKQHLQHQNRRMIASFYGASQIDCHAFSLACLLERLSAASR